jgi:hypothetical protein
MAFVTSRVWAKFHWLGPSPCTTLDAWNLLRCCCTRIETLLSGYARSKAVNGRLGKGNFVQQGTFKAEAYRTERPTDNQKDPRKMNKSLKKVSVVEAAGIEPASEKARHEKTTCVSDSLFVGDSPVNRQDGHHLARLISILSYGQKPRTYPAI